MNWFNLTKTKVIPMYDREKNESRREDSYFSYSFNCTFKYA